MSEQLRSEERTFPLESKCLFDKSQLFTLLGDAKETRRDAVAVIKERIRFKGSICCALYIRPCRCDARDKKKTTLALAAS